MLSFLFCGHGKLLVTKSSFDEFNNVFFMAERKRSCFEIHSRQQSFGRLFKKIFYSMITKNTFLKGSCHVNDVQIFFGRNSAGFTSNFYLQILIVHFFCIQIHRTFRSFHFVIAFTLWQLLSYSTNELANSKRDCDWLI